MKKIIVFLAIVINIFGIPQSAYAHVLIKDQIQGVGAILHVNPDDDPVAGEPASLFFDIQDQSLAQKKAAAKLTITNERNEVSIAPSKLEGTSVSLDYTFPRQGIYKIKLVIIQGDKPTHTFLQSQRVSRGIMGGVSTTSTPAWTQAGIVAAVVGVTLIFIIAFNRRKDINNYSKF